MFQAPPDHRYNYEGKVQAALNALHRLDFVYLHIEAPDEAGHEGDWCRRSGPLSYLTRRRSAR